MKNIEGNKINLIKTNINVFNNKDKVTSILPGNIEVMYEVKQFSTEDKILSVSIKIINACNFKTYNYQLIKGYMKITEVRCVDSFDNPVRFSIAKGIIDIDKIDDKENYVLFSYNVEIGDLHKHGANGGVYSDLLTFPGESVLVMPINALKENMEEINNIKKLNIKYMVPDTWDVIIPFPKKNVKGITEVINPTWTSLYEIRKSSFTFGKFQKHKHLNRKLGYTVYLDKDAEKYYTQSAMRGIDNIYKYYCELFNYNLENFAIVLLRKDEVSHNYIISGSSTKNLVSTFDNEIARDWQLLGHRLFHSFFESQVTATKYHEPPLLNLYEGLATYYENISMKSLPENIKNQLNIDPDNEILELFQRYIYMKLKNPSNYSLIPILERKIFVSPAKIEFLHYTQAPLIVKYLEDSAFKKYGKRDNIINYILKNKDDNSVTVGSIANSLLGNGAMVFTHKYISGDEILPLWGLSNKEENKDVIGKLNTFEYNMYTWFYRENTLYSYDVLNDDKLSDLSKEADKQGLHFADTMTEANVKKMSPTIYSLLKEYKLRAKVCSVNINDKYSRESLLVNKNNLEIWNNYKL